MARTRQIVLVKIAEEEEDLPPWERGRGAQTAQPGEAPDESDSGGGSGGGGASRGGGSSEGGKADLASMGTLNQVCALLSQFNISSDGAADSFGLLYGPGLIVQLPIAEADAPVRQLLVSIDEEDSAWPVLLRLCRALGWRMMEAGAGR